jgi:hypothetical protein
MWHRRAVALSCLALVAESLAAPRPSSGQDSTPPLSPYEARLKEIVKGYNQQVIELIDVERHRLIEEKGEPDPTFMDKPRALQGQFDQEFVTLLQEATQANPPAALRLFFAWQHGQAVFHGLEPSEALISQITAAAPDWQKARQFMWDTLVTGCNSQNAMEVAPTLVNVAAGGEVTNTPIAEDWAPRVAACQRKATLVLDFDSEIDAVNFRQFQTSNMHVRAQHVVLTYIPEADQFVEQGATLDYVSYRFTPSQYGRCDSAAGHPGKINVTAKMTRNTGEIKEFLVEIDAVAEETYWSPDLSNFMKMGGRDGERPGKCPPRKSSDMREHWMGFNVTSSSAPFTIRLGESMSLPSQPWTGGDLQFTAHTTVSLHHP